MNADGHSASDILKVLLFSIFFLPLILYWGFDFFCYIGVMTPTDKPKPKPKRQHVPVQHPEWHGIQNDTPDDPYLEPETDQQLIDDVIACLQNVGFKKRDAKLAVLKACEGKVFEGHQALIEAALNKSNL